MLTSSISINNAVPNTPGGFERCVGIGVLGEVERIRKQAQWYNSTGPTDVDYVQIIINPEDKKLAVLFSRYEATAWTVPISLADAISQMKHGGLIGKRYEKEKMIGAHNAAGINQHKKKEVRPKMLTEPANVLGVDNEDQIKSKRDFVSGKLSYQEWTRLDCRDLVENKLHLSHFDKIINSGKCSLTKNLMPAIKKQRENGVLTAIISGGVDTLLYKLLPEVEMLFNEVFINQFVYSEAGYLQGINATEYDWDDNKLGVVGKNRGLQRICEKYCIPIESSVFCWG